MSEILSFFPKNLQKIIHNLDGIVQTHVDSLSVCLLSGLASLSGGATVSTGEGKGRPIILYTAAFMQSGTGKSAAANVVRKYILGWREEELKKEDAKRKASATKEAPAKPTQDVFLEAASAEGLETSLNIGSSPFIFLDELGLMLKMAKNDTVKAALIKALMSVFDSGSFVTRRLKEEKRAALVTAQGMGLFAASTLGVANLSNQDLKDMISNGALNRFLITFGGIKAIPLKDELNEMEAKEAEKFARDFLKTAEGKQYKFDDEAKKFYLEYHKKINIDYLDKLYQMNDEAGLVVRKLTFVQRLAAIMQICSDFEKAENQKIGLEAVKNAADLIDYLDATHFSQIGLYARSKSGKISVEQRVMDKISKKPGINYRAICQSFTMLGIKAEQIKTALDILVSTKKITEQNGNYHKS